jgi:hypothetical protein
MNEKRITWRWLQRRCPDRIPAANRKREKRSTMERAASPRSRCQHFGRRRARSSTYIEAAMQEHAAKHAAEEGEFSHVSLKAGQDAIVTGIKRYLASRPYCERDKCPIWNSLRDAD